MRLHTAKALLAIVVVLALGGCFVEEDTISITANGIIKFESVVTVPDEDKKMQFADVEKATRTLLDELRAHHWQITETWVTKERPYQLKVAGEGKLADVIGGTRLYSLTQVTDRLYRIHFGTPGSESQKSQRRIVFTPTMPDGKSGVYSTDGKPVMQIDKVEQTDTYSIVLPPVAG